MKFWTIDFGAHVRLIQWANLRRWNFELIKFFLIMLRAPIWVCQCFFLYFVMCLFSYL